MFSSLNIFRKNWPYFIFIFLLSIWSTWYLWKVNYFYSHDLDYNLIRIMEASSLLREGILPFRWSFNLNYGCGVPVFNFYYPLVYYLGSFLYLLTGDLLFSWKIILFLSLFFSSWFFFVWIRQETKDNLSSLGAAILYLLAPYRFSLVFVRGSVEFLTYMLLPFVFYLISFLINSSKNHKKRFLLGFILSISFCLYLLSHNVAVLITFPLIIFYLLAKFFSKKLNNFRLVLFSLVLGFGMALFFIGPALTEKKYVILDLVGSAVDYKDHFLSLFQLFYSKWGFLFSVRGLNDGMSFMLGYAQWLVVFASILVVIYLFFFRKKLFCDLLNQNLYFFCSLPLFLISIFIMLPYSSFIWENFDLLKNVQFPWRFLGVAVFLVSLLFAFVLLALRKVWDERVMIFFLVFILFLAFWGSRNHRRLFVLDNIYGNDLAKHPLRYSTTTIADEILAKGQSSKCQSGEKFVSEGSFSDLNKKQDSGYLKLSLDNAVSDKIVFALEYFPGAYVFNINGKNVVYENCEGRVCIDRNEFGFYNLISWRLVQTDPEKFFNFFSLSSLALWLLVIIYFYIGKRRLFFLLLLAFFIFLRIYNLESRLPFGWDQERDAFSVLNILKGKLTLIGPRVVGPSGFFLPPYFFYLLSPFYFIFKLNPYYSLAFFLVVYWILFFFVARVSLSSVFSKDIFYSFILIWTVLPGAIVIDRIPWNPLLVPLFFPIILFLFFKYFRTNKVLWFFLISLVYFFGVSFHPQLFFYIPFVVLALIKRWKRDLIRKLLLFLLSSFLVFLPLLLFDIRHNFLNVNLLLKFAGSESFRGGLVDVWQNLVSMVFGFNFSKLFAIVFYFILIFVSLFFYFLEKDNLKKIVFLALIFVLILPVLFFGLFYDSRPSEYYFNFSLPVVVFLFAFGFSRFNLPKKLIFPLLVLILSFSLLRSWRSLYNYDGESIFYKEKVVYFLKMITAFRNDFDVSFDIKEGKDAGFYYLLDINKIGYNKNDGSPLIQIMSDSTSDCLVKFKQYSICFNPRDFGW